MSRQSMVRGSPRRFGSVLLPVIALTLSTEALAQIEEIVVTARKREESLQDVPIAIQAISETQLQRLGVDSLSDIAKLSASVIFDTGFAPQDTRVTIRGLAPVRGRQNVAILQDGIDISSQAIQTNGGSLLISPRLFDLERVEVVKGPQNALYGRSAFNGAINYVTRKPSEELSGRVSADLGQNGRAELKGGISGPLVGDTLLGDITVATWNFDGFHRNSVTGAKVGGEEGFAGSASLLWKPLEQMSIRARVEYVDDEFESFPYTQLGPNSIRSIPLSARTAPAPGIDPVISPALTEIGVYSGRLPKGDDLQVTLSEDPRTGSDYPGTERDIKRYTLIGDYDFGPVTLTYLGQEARAETSQYFDAVRIGSFSVEPVGSEFRFDDETRLSSHELRLASNEDGRINWTAGVLYWKEKVEQVDGSFNCINTFTAGLPPCAAVMTPIGTPASPLNEDFWSRETEHWSVYGLVEWQFMEAWNLILEGRYTDEDLDVAGPIRTANVNDRIVAQPFSAGFYPTSIPANSGLAEASDSDSFFSPKATIEWKPSDNTMYYLSWAKATKPSGIALITGGAGGFDPDANRFEAEEMTVWELGAKTNWLDNRVLLNGALFFQDYSDKQVSSQQVVGNTLLPRPTNASSAEVLGLEFELAWQLNDALTLRGGYTFLSTEYQDYQQLSGGSAPIANAGNCTVVVPPGGTRGSCELDLSGNELEYAPRHAFVGGFTLSQPLPNDMSWFIDGDMTFQDARFAEQFNVVKLDRYTTVDFRVGLVADWWEVIAYVENAFNDDTVKTAVGGVWTPGLAAFFNPFTLAFPTSQIVLLPDERQMGVRANFRFGGR